MRGCRGACMVAGGACMVAGGALHGCTGGACVVAPGGMHGCLGGHAWLLRGCVRGCSGGHAWLLGGHVWLLLGGCMVLLGGMRGFFHEIRSMSGRYASYWNAFLLAHEIHSQRHLFYGPQTKFAKVMFLHVSVCPRVGGNPACLAGFQAHTQGGA